MNGSVVGRGGVALMLHVSYSDETCYEDLTSQWRILTRSELF
jgi:hypothetical protein